MLVAGYTHKKKSFCRFCNSRIFSTVRLIKNVIESYMCYTNYANKEEDIYNFIFVVYFPDDTHACTTNN